MANKTYDARNVLKANVYTRYTNEYGECLAPITKITIDEGSNDTVASATLETETGQKIGVTVSIK